MKSGPKHVKPCSTWRAFINLEKIVPYDKTIFMRLPVSWFNFQLTKFYNGDSSSSSRGYRNWALCSADLIFPFSWLCPYCCLSNARPTNSGVSISFLSDRTNTLYNLLWIFLDLWESCPLLVSPFWTKFLLTLERFPSFWEPEKKHKNIFLKANDDRKPK